jgi:hypothetical protein
MTLLGKIFTLCIFIASLFLMFVAMVVYATHRNWQQAFTDAKAQLQAKQQENANLEARYQNQVAKLSADSEAWEQQVRKLESELVTVRDLNQRTQLENDELRQERRAAESLVAATERNNESLTTEVVALRGTTQQSQAARDAAWIQTLKATTDLHVTAGELQSLQERSQQLIAQLAHYTSALVEAGIDPEADVVVQAYGEVSGIRRADGGQLVEITIGYDDGVRKGHTVEIFRGELYLGRASIIDVDPDRSVGRVLREFQQGQIQEGDRVATKLRGI